MSLVDELRIRAAKDPKRIILPEGNESRTLKAAEIALKLGMADITILGDVNEINKLAKSLSVDLSKAKFIDPKKSAELKKIADTFYELRKHKGITPEEAYSIVSDKPLYFGAMMVALNMADGFVAGALNTTPDVTKAAIYCVKPNKKVGSVSSCFLIEMDDKSFGEQGIFIYADCGTIPDPSSVQLANIAISAGRLFKKLFNAIPRVAMLSYSTKGSAEGELVEKVVNAVKKANEIAPDIFIDGEFQLDAAIVPEVAKIKCGASPVAGRANVLIFPNLDSGNICYKLTQRLAKARAVGPFMIGLNKPCSDLSRGCLIEDIVDAIALTVVSAQVDPVTHASLYSS